MRSLPTKLHAIIDYLIGILLICAPQFFGWDKGSPFDAIKTGVWEANDLFWVLGIVTIVYSLFTAYDLSLVRIIPIELNFLADCYLGTILLGTAWLMNSLGPCFTGIVALLGLISFGNAAASKVVMSRKPHGDDAYIISNFIADWTAEQWE